MFLQWLDCVHQILKQFPTSFQFNEHLLVRIVLFPIIIHMLSFDIVSLIFEYLFCFFAFLMICSQAIASIDFLT